MSEMALDHVRAPCIFDAEADVELPLVEYDVVFGARSFIVVGGEHVRLLALEDAPGRRCGGCTIDARPGWRPVVERLQRTGRLRFTVKVDVPDPSLAGFFDERPDPRLVQRVALHYTWGETTPWIVKFEPRVTIAAPGLNSDTYDTLGFRYRPDCIDEVHEWIRARSDPRFSFCVEFGRCLPTRLFGAFTIKETFERWSHCRIATSDQRRLIVPTTQRQAATVLAHFETIARDADTSWRIVVRSPDNTVLRFGEAPEGHAAPVERIPSELAPLSWPAVASWVFETALVLHKLPAYVILWIMQQLPLYAMQREKRMITCIWTVVETCRELRKTNKRRA